MLAWPDINNGYQDLGNIEVLKVAGVPVHNLAHLAYVLTNLHKEAPASGAPYVRLDLQWHKVRSSLHLYSVAHCGKRAACSEL